MSNTILIKRSGTANSVPTSGQLSLGELAINYTDGNLFYKDGGGTVNLLVSNKFVSVVGNVTAGNVIVTSLTSTRVPYVGANEQLLDTSNFVWDNPNQVLKVGAGGTEIGGDSGFGYLSTTTVSAGGNITGGNLKTGGLISATGNITAGNLNAAGLSLSSNVVSALNVTSNIAGGNINTPGLVSAAGNITASGNVSGNYILGNGSFLTGVITSVANINNGTSNVTVVSSGGNVTVGIGGTSNVVVWATTGEYVTGLISATGNITGGNLITAGAISAASVSASGNVTGGNLNAAGLSLSSNVVSALNVTSNIAGGNINTVGQVSASGNITGNYLIGNLACASGIYTSKIFNGTSEANIGTSGGNANISIAGTSNVVVVTTGGIDITGTVSANGNVTGGNINTGGLVSAGGNITGGNVITAGVVSAASVSVSGNITGGNITTSGSSGNIFGANVISGVTLSASGNVTASGNVSGNYILGNGALLTGVITSVANINLGTSNVTVVSSGGNVTVGIGGTSNVVVWATTGEYVTGVVSATGNITGGNLVTAAAVSAASISASGNVTGGNANITGTTASTSKTTGALTVAGGVGVAADLYVGNSLVVDNGAYGNVTTTQFASVFGSGGGANPYSIMQVRSSDGVSGLGMQAFTGSGTLYGNAVINFALATVRDKDIPSNLSIKANINSAGLNVTGIVSATGNVTGGNLNAAGLSLSSNVISALNLSSSLTAATTISAVGNITGGNLNAAGLSLSGNVVSALNASSSIAAGSTISAVGNITGGNLITAAAVSAGSVSASGNVTGGNVNTNTIVGTSTTIKSTGDLILSATGNISVNSYINNVTTPVQDADAANKGYVDSVAQGLDAKASVHTATTAALPAYTYNNGASGVGATLTGTATGTLTVAGDTILFGQRVLVKDETGAFVNNTTMSAAFNGIYVCTTEGAVGVAYVLTRAVDFDIASEMYSAFTFVETGTGIADTGWVCTNNLANPITVGTTQIIFAQFSGAGQYTANTSAGLSLTGTVFSAKVDGNTNPTIGFDGSGNLYVPAGAAFTTPNIGAASGSSLSVTGNITSGNLNAAGLSLSSNVVSALNVTGSIAGGNVTTPGLISATGTITGGNLAAGSGTISTSGNITGGNVLFGSGIVSGTGNITGGNLNATGLSLSGNVVSVFNVTGNITGGNVNGVNGVYSGGVQVLTINDTVDGGTY